MDSLAHSPVHSLQLHPSQDSRAPGKARDREAADRACSPGRRKEPGHSRKGRAVPRRHPGHPVEVGSQVGSQVGSRIPADALVMAILVGGHIPLGFWLEDRPFPLPVFEPIQVRHYDLRYRANHFRRHAVVGPDPQVWVRCLRCRFPKHPVRAPELAAEVVARCLLRRESVDQCECQQGLE